MPLVTKSHVWKLYKSRVPQEQRTVSWRSTKGDIIFAYLHSKPKPQSERKTPKVTKRLYTPAEFARVFPVDDEDRDDEFDRLTERKTSFAPVLAEIKKIAIKKARFERKQLKKQQKEQKRQRFKQRLQLITVQFRWWFTGYPVRPNMQNLATTFITKTRTPRLVREKAMGAARAHIINEGVERPGYEIEIEILNVDTQPMPEDRDIKEFKFFGNNLCYPNLGIPLEESKTCGIDFLKKKFPRLARKFDLEKYERFGMTPNDYLTIYKQINYPLLMVDLESSKIVRHMVDRKCKSRKKPSVLIYANQHITEITGDRRTQILHSMANYERGSTTANIERVFEETEQKAEIKFVDSLAEVDIDAKQTHYHTKENINEYYYDFLNQDTVYPSNWIVDKVSSIYFNNGTRLIFNPLYHRIRRACEIYDLEFKSSLRMPKVGRLIFDRIAQSEAPEAAKWHESHFNKETAEIMSSDLLPVGWMHFNNETIDNTDGLQGLDYYKNYSSIAREGNFYYYDIDARVDRYDGDIKHGLYYVESENTFPLRGNGWYDFKLVEFCLEEGIPMTIKYQLLGRPCSENDYILKTFVDYCYEKSPSDGKFIVNAKIGDFCTVSDIKYGKTVITNNMEEAAYYYFKHQRDSTIAVWQHYNGKKLYRTTCVDYATRMSNNKSVYCSIIHRAYMRLYKLWKAIEMEGGECVGVKSDCVFFKAPYGIGELAAMGFEQHEDAKLPFGTVRFEEPEKIPVIIERKSFQNSNTYRRKFRAWKQKEEHKANHTDYYNVENIEQYSRLFVEGFAGSGKSHLIGQMVRKNPRLQPLAFTNTAANNINGLTLHNFFGISVAKGKADSKTIKKILANYDGVIIDEVNQVPKFIYRILLTLPKTFKIYGFGDFRQETPVEPNDETHMTYDNAEFFKQLFGFNKIKLLKQCRADVEYANFCMRYHDDHVQHDRKPVWQMEKSYDNTELQKYVKFGVGESKDELILCKTTQMRKKINHDHMDKTGMHIPHDEKNKQGQDMWITVGMPIIACESFAIQGARRICNNQMFTITKISKKRIIFETRRMNPNTVIERYQMEMKDLARYFQPGYALTSYRVEGYTIAFPYSIYEFNRMTAKTRYTCLTRATDAALISLYNHTYKNVNFPEAPQAHIYKIFNTDKPDMVYVGSTRRTIEQRFAEHREDCNKNNSKFYQYMRAAPEKFIIETLETFSFESHQHQLDREQYYIEMYDSVRRGLNSKSR